MVWTGIMTGIFLADTVIKNEAEKHLNEKALREVAGDKILLRKLHNYGAACNLGEKYPEVIEKSTLVLWIALFAYYLKQWGRSGKRLEKLGGALLLGGGLSNLTDRLTKGYVTDYFSLNVKWEKIRCLVFNLSDFCIMAGICLSMLSRLGQKKTLKEEMGENSCPEA